VTAFTDLVAAALVGSRRPVAAVPSLPDDLKPFFDPAKPYERTLLDAAAAVLMFNTCGRVAGVDDSPLSACPADEKPECSNRAADLLSQAIAANRFDLIGEWLTLANRAGRRVPYRVLPSLLDKAATKADLRDAVKAAGDRRGEWLAAKNTAWQFGKALPANLHELWQTGTRPERKAALQAIRAAEPATARDWIAETWTADGADDRVEWLEIVANRLSNDDEAFLEARLDDRSSRVRETAADLLARRPESAFVKRMIARCEPCLAFTPAQSGSLLKLKRGTAATLTITLPGEFDKAMQRDGMSEKPGEKIGPKQWWLRQMLAGVPPTSWTTKFGVSPMELIAAVEAEHADLLVTAWRMAIVRNPDPAWAVALLTDPRGSFRWEPEILKTIPEAERVNVVAWLPTTETTGELAQSLIAWSPLSAAVSKAVVARFPAESLLHANAAMHLHPAALAELDVRLAEPLKQPYMARMASDAQTTVALRRAMHEEFAR
jgi:hypothetical protein